MPDAFISYRRVPSFALTKMIQNDLKYTYQIDAYMDVTRREGALVPFPDRLLGAIEQSPIFICVLGEGTLDSEWVLKEIRYAYALQKPCIPIFHEDYKPSVSDDPAIRYLLNYDAVHFIDKRGVLIDGSMHELADLIQRTLKSHPKHPPQSNKKITIVIGALALLFSIGIIFSRLLMSNNVPILTETASPPTTITMSSTDQQTSSEYWVMGQEFYNSGDYDQALIAYTEAINLNPELAYIYNSRGWTYHLLKQYELAITDYDKAIGLDPDFTYAYNNRGWAYQILEEYDKAIKDFDQAISLSPNYVDAYNNRGQAYHEMGNYEEAIVNFNTAIELSPETANLYNNRGNSYRRLQRYDNAISNYTEAIRFNGQYAIAYNNRGFTYEEIGDCEKSINDYQKALEINPNYLRAQTNLDRVLRHCQSE